MGDRRQAVVQSNGESVYLYTHWAGSELPEIVKSAMIRGKNRWDDAPYLTRIIFCEMVRGIEMEETGAGIWSSSQDSNHHDIFINMDKKTVTISDDVKSFREFTSSK